MKCFFRSFDVGIGDCNVIRLVKGDGTQLVATHIDGDHIKGMAAMLKNCPNLQIDKIWYNCYGRCRQAGTDGLTEEQSEVLN